MENTHSLYNKTKGSLLIKQLNIADTFVSRFLGLMGKTVEPTEGLLIKPCNSIHCMFMKIPIDVIFVNEDNKVVHKILNMKPWTLSPIIKTSKYVVESPIGRFTDVNIGDEIEIVTHKKDVLK